MEQGQIFLLNNRGVQLIRHGNLAASEYWIRRALEGSLTRLVPRRTTDNPALSSESTRQSNMQVSDDLEDTQPDDIRTMNQVDGASTGSLSFSEQVGVPEVFMSNQSPEGLSDHSDRKCDARVYLHTQGISISPELSLAYLTTDPVISEAIMTSVLIYNLGLINQLRSICGFGWIMGETDQQAEKDSYYFRLYSARNARLLYRRSRLILHQAGVDTGQATGLALVDFLSMALYNNIAFAAFDEGDYEVCQELFQMLADYKTSVQIIASNSSWDTDTITTMYRYMSDFLLNSMILKRPTVAAAA